MFFIYRNNGVFCEVVNNIFRAIDKVVIWWALHSLHTHSVNCGCVGRVGDCAVLFRFDLSPSQPAIYFRQNILLRCNASEVVHEILKHGNLLRTDLHQCSHCKLPFTRDLRPGERRACLCQ